jgi:tetratricopeptide (TPR) repeat protein
MNLRLNARFCCGLVLALVALGGGMHLLRGYQIRRQAGHWLERADLAESQNNLGRSMAYLRRYLAVRPDNLEVRARYALQQARLAQSADDRRLALSALEEVLQKDPQRREVRQTAVAVAMHPDLERFAEAAENLQVLLQASPEDGVLEYLLGRCQEAQGQYKLAAASYESASRHDPRQLDSFVRQALLLRRHLRRPAAADAVMTKMVEVQPSGQSYLRLAQYVDQFDKTEAGEEKSAQAVRRARELAPDDPDVALAVAALAREGGAKGRPTPAEARRLLEKAIDASPRDTRLHLALGRLEARTDRRAEAIATLRRGLEARPGQALLLWELANLLLDDGRVDEAREAGLSLQEEGVPGPWLDYLEARLLLAAGRWPEAIATLERLQGLLAPWPNLVRRSNLMLGQCYEQFGDVTRRYTAYQRAALADPLAVAPHLGMGSALEAMGRLDEALEAYRSVPAKNQTTAVRLRVARLMIRRNQELPKDQQQWAEVENILQEAAQASGQDADIDLVRVGMLLARGDSKGAADHLASARRRNPRDAKLWAAQAELADQRGETETVLPLLDEAQRTLGDRIELRLARTGYWIHHDPKRAGAALEPLGRDVARFSTDEQLRLLRGLAAAYGQLGDRDGAIRMWSEVARLQPRDLSVRINLIDLALAGGDEAAVEQTVQDIRALEGEEGAIWRYAQARLLIRRATRGDKGGLAEARQLLARIATQRPAWSRVPLCEAALHEVAGNKELAVARYQDALERGERTAAQRLVPLLYDLRRYADAELVLKKFADGAVVDSRLQHLAAEVSLQTQDYDRAVRLARKAVALDTRDYREHLWLGQILDASPVHRAEAEKPLQQALALASGAPETWVALVQHFVRTGRKVEAEELIQKAQQKLPRNRSRLALARCHEAVNQLDRARALYNEALAVDSRDTNTLNAAAKFYLRTGDLAEAQKLLERIITVQTASEDVGWARRTLAFVLTVQGGYESKRRALALLGLLDNTIDDASAKEMPAEEVRTSALALAASTERARRQQAIRLLEGLESRRLLSPDDAFLLAQVYDSVGQWHDARQRMLRLLAAHGDNLLYVAYYAERLLHHQEAAAGLPWLAKLEAKQPNAFRTVRLKARLFKALGRDAEAIAAVKKYAAVPSANLGGAALLLEGLGDFRAAEDTYQRFVAEANRPEAILVLAQFHGRRGRTEQALKLCEGAWSRCPPGAVAAACIQILGAAKDPRPHCPQVRRWFDAAHGSGARRTNLTAHLAALLNLQGDYQASQDIYERMIAQDANNILALNNLAFLLALNANQGQRALELLNRACERAGPSATLLDTRAVVELTLGHTDRAIRDLEEVAAQAPTAAVYFHLAQAHLEGGNRKAALQAFRKSQELGLQPGDLHPLENSARQRVFAALAGD